MPERLNAVITACKPRFLQKTISFNIHIEDAFNIGIYTNLSVFIPKLTPKYPLACVMVNLSNGRSSCLFRCQDPIELKKHLLHMVDLLDSQLFKERWERIKDHSDNLITNGFLSAYDPLYFKP